MIYIDCDNVLADFNKFVIEQTGSPYQGKETCNSNPKGLNSWEVLENIDNLFRNLEVMKDAASSVQNILNQQGWMDVEILTALPLLSGKLWQSQRDKVDWAHLFIDDAIQVNCVANWRHKKYFCRDKYDILIDDCLRNCSEWTSAGGIAVLHKDWESTNAELKKIGVI